MPRVARFNDLPELVLIELFHYLSSVDILLTFNDYNHHIQQLLHERGFFRRLNLSSASLYKFDALLKRLPLTQIETLVVDVDAPSLQLTRFPYLPNLTTLRLYGVRHLTDAYKFIRRHSRSLQCLTLQTNGLFRPIGFIGSVLHPTDRLETFMEDVLPRLHALRSLDLGQYFGATFPLWQPTTIKCPLTHLRLPLQDVERLCKLMALKQPSSTLTELHVAIRGFCVCNTENILSRRLVSTKLTNLHSFSLTESIFSRNCQTYNCIDWRTIEYLTTPDVMPVLRHMKLVLFITANELHRIAKSALFTDDRGIDVQFAFVMQKNSRAIQLTGEIPNGSRSHPRETVGVTCDLCWMKREYEHMTNLDCYYDAYREIFHVWYTLPWTFDEFFAVDDAVAYITNVEAIIPSQHHSTTIYPSQLRTLAVSQNNSSPAIMKMPQVVQLKRINTVHLSFHDWPTCLNLPNVYHVTLTNCLTVLTSFSSFPPTIRSIQLIFHARMPNLVCNDWSVLRSLPSLPKLTSLQIVFHDMNIHLDEDSCQIIAETASMLVHFGICFRRRVGEQSDPDDFNPPNVIRPGDWDALNVDPNLVIGADGNLGRGVIRFLNSVVDNYKKSIKEIHRRILNLSFRVKPVIVVEKGNCGLTAWF